jgi:hypothetical protein
VCVCACVSRQQLENTQRQFLEHQDNTRRITGESEMLISKLRNEVSVYVYVYVCVSIFIVVERTHPCLLSLH